MPLKPGKSDATVSSNIEELHEGQTHATTQAKHGKAAADKQSIAIALDQARKSGRTRPRRARTTR